MLISRALRSRVLFIPVLAAALAVPGVALAEDTAPDVVTNPTVTGRVLGGHTVSCDGAVFSGPNLGAVSYAWFKMGAGQIGTGQTYLITAADVGWDINCRATVSNGAGPVEANSPVVAVEDGTPNNSSKPKITGKAQPGSTVTCSTGAWSGDGNTYAMQWMKDSKPIAGATKPQLLLLDSFDDRAISCKVTATNVSGSASMASDPVMPYHLPIKVAFAKVQPKLPKLGQAIASGITTKLVCNGSCATLAHAFILTSEAKRYGIKGRDLGGVTIIGTGNAKRTFAGEKLATIKLSASAKKGLAKAKGAVRVDLLFETAWGPKYAHTLRHEAIGKTIKLKR